jgi:beta-lactamase class A
MNERTRGMLLLVLVALCSSLASSAGTEQLRRAVDQIVSNAHGTIGVAVLHLESGDTLTVNGHAKLPMQSVYKYPLGLAVLRQVDLGTLSLDQRIPVKKSDLLPKTWSPLREKYPNADTAVALEEILKFTVAQSDNNGCDMLFRLLGGPKNVDSYIRSLGINDIAILNTEEEMGKDKTAQFRNYVTPYELARLLSLMYRGKVLSEKNTRTIIKILEETTTGPKRLKGQLPQGTVVAHKTGSSGTDERGITHATNDAGIITLPDGSHVAVVVFVSNSPADEKEREGVISSIAKTVWDNYTGR